MKFQYFSLYDKQSATLLPPFMCTNEVEAKRIITMQLQDPKNANFKDFADCYDLYKLCEISDEMMRMHVPTKEEREVNAPDYRYVPDVGINDVKPEDMIKVDRTFICTVKSIKEFLDLVAEQKEKAND